MPVMSGKRAFLDLLKQEGVKVMFGNPGTTELPLMDAFAVENDIRYILGPVSYTHLDVYKRQPTIFTPARSSASPRTTFAISSASRKRR